MNLITRISYWLANILATKAERNDKDYIRYGIEISLSVLSKILFFVIISLFFDVLLEMMIVAFTFALFRIFSGGVHLSTYYRCLFTSTILFLVPAILLAKLINLSTIISLVFIYLVLIMGIIIIFLYVPSSASNRPIPIEKHKSFRLKSYTFLFTVHIFHSYLITTNYWNLVFYSSSGILLQTFSLTPLGISFFKFIDRVFDRSLKIKGGKNGEKSI